MNKQIKALKEAILIAGTQVKLAKSVGVTIGATTNWITRGSIPAKNIIEIEKATGIRCEVLCPDIDWEFLRGTSKAKKAKK